MLRSIIMISLAGLMTLSGLAQSSDRASEKQSATPHAVENATRFYQLSFVLQELDNERIINSRKYTMIMRSGKEQSPGSIRAGEKVPFSSTSGASTQWQQIDVGVSIDCQRLEDRGNGVSLHIRAEISNVMDTHGESSPHSSLPIIRNDQWASTVVLPMNRPTVLFSSDDPASKRTMRLQLTVALVR